MHNSQHTPHYHSKVTHHSTKEYRPTIKTYTVSIYISTIISNHKHGLTIKTYKDIKAHDGLEAFRLAKIRCKELNPTVDVSKMVLSSIWENVA